MRHSKPRLVDMRPSGAKPAEPRDDVPIPYRLLPRADGGFSCPADDPSVGKECATCHRTMEVGQRLAASGWRHLDCGSLPLIEKVADLCRVIGGAL